MFGCKKKNKKRERGESKEKEKNVRNKVDLRYCLVLNYTLINKIINGLLILIK